MRNESLDLEKLKIASNIRELELQVTRLVAHAESEAGNVSLMLKRYDENINKLNIIITGNGHPEEGLSFRIKQIENNEAGKKQNSVAIWTFLSSLGVIVVSDIINRVFIHHK